MSELGKRISSMAIDAVKGRVSGFPFEKNYCLAFAFEAVARQLNTTRFELYRVILDSSNSDSEKRRWAVDAEVGIERIGFDILIRSEVAPNDTQLHKKIQVGDLLFSRNSGNPEGHVAIYVGVIDGVMMVAENTTANRGKSYRYKYLRLTPLSDWNLVSSVARPNTNWSKKR